MWVGIIYGLRVLDGDGFSLSGLGWLLVLLARGVCAGLMLFLGWVCGVLVFDLGALGLFGFGLFGLGGLTDFGGLLLRCLLVGLTCCSWVLAGVLCGGFV